MFSERCMDKSPAQESTHSAHALPWMKLQITWKQITGCMWRSQLAAGITWFLHTHTHSIISPHLLHSTSSPSAVAYPVLLAKVHPLWLYLTAVLAYTPRRVYWRWPSPGAINISGSLSTLAHGGTWAAQGPGGGADGETEQEGKG